MTEAEKILDRVLPLLQGKSVLDLGCGHHPVVPWAVGVDDSSESKLITPVTVIASVDPDGQRALSYGVDNQVDVVFSSHTAEHIRAPILQTLKYWLSFVRQGGLLILYLPDERRYVFNPQNPKERNPSHHHYLTPETFRWHLDQLPIDIEALEEDPVIFDRYSFLVIARKR